MLSSTPNPKFLLDENVHLSLFKYLAKKSVDAKIVPKSASDEQIAAISKRDKRVLVTNDEDFANYTKDDVFAVIWLQIPQNDLKTLLFTFRKLLDSSENFPGKLIVLKRSAWDVFDLGSWGEMAP